VSFLTPLALLAGGVSAAAVIALHLLARQRPRAAAFPPARFVPDQPVRAPSLARRPTDLVLLALRVAALLLLATAFARPVLDGRRRSIARVVALDRSRAVASLAEGRDSARAILGSGDRLVMFDSMAGIAPVTALDSLAKEASEAPGSLSAALIASIRAAPAFRASADSVELVLISPLVREEWDAATAAIRATWPGRVRVIRVRASATPRQASQRVEIIGREDDPLRATAGLLGARAAIPVRVLRQAAAAGDSEEARDGRVLVYWPEDGGGFPRRARPDTIGAVVAGDVVLVAPFVRATTPPPGRVIARWADGQPAATEREVGGGCFRDVAITLDAAGDVALRESAQHLLAALAAPCGGARELTPLADSLAERLRGARSLVAAKNLTGKEAPESPLARWLLLASALTLLVEMIVRQYRGAGRAS